MATAKKATAKKAAKKKTTARKVPTKSQVTGSAPAKKASARKVKAPRAPKSKPVPAITPEERYKMINEAAYYAAEKNHWAGDPGAYWVQAEKEVDALIGKAK